MAYRQLQSGSFSARSGAKVTQSRVNGPPVEMAALDQAKAVRIGQLWASADAYERRFFSAGAHAQILESKMAGNKKAVKLRQWIQGLWRDYYYRKDMINGKQSVAEVHNVDITFDARGAPPYSIREILEESPA